MSVFQGWQWLGGGALDPIAAAAAIAQGSMKMTETKFAIDLAPGDIIRVGHAVCTAEDRRNALLAQALDLLRLVVIPPMDGSPGHEVAQWLLDQEEAIAFLKQMGQSPKRLSDDDRS